MTNLARKSDYRWKLPREDGMNTEGTVFSSSALIDEIIEDNALDQVANVAKLPGIVGTSMAMPDIHWGYGFPIGGVAAFDMEEGVVSPGGVGYDINCGVRLLRSELTKNKIKDSMQNLINDLYRNVPSGVGSESSKFRLNTSELKKLLKDGAGWVVSQGHGVPEDLEMCEENGAMEGAEPSALTKKAIKRGKPQVGTLGSGNHFCEVDFVDEVYDREAAKTMGLFEDQIVVFIHCGSRGLGHQICDDSIDVMLEAARKYNIDLPDKQLCCAPVQSDEGQNYLEAMRCAVNYAFANRQMITDLVRETFLRSLKMSPVDLQMDLVYDVCHNIAKIEKHQVDGEQRELCIHRKGATRAFPPGHDEIPEKYGEIGQPVFIPGDMGRYSYVLSGTKEGFETTWGSTCHGAGRKMSRRQAKKLAKGRQLYEEMKSSGVYAKADSTGTLAEEIPDAYKDVSEVVEAVEGAGISKKVAKLKPMGVIKG